LWRPGIVPRGIKALRRLRAAAPVLVAWAAASGARSEPEASEVHQARAAILQPL
jgi:hypothetical protein